MFLYIYIYVNFFILFFKYLFIFMYIYVGGIQQVAASPHMPHPKFMIYFGFQIPFPFLSTPRLLRFPFPRLFMAQKSTFFTATSWDQLGNCHLIKGHDCSSPGTVN